MKVFISQPMGKFPKDYIINERNRIITYLKACYGEDIEILDTMFDFPGKSPLYYLAQSIEVLSQADFAYFMKGWQDFRGCRIEHECCAQYNIPIVYEV